MKYKEHEKKVTFAEDEEYYILKAKKQHIEQLKEKCVKGCTKEKLTETEAETFYNDFVKNKMLYHYPEDSDTLNTIIDTFNYLNKWK